MFKSIKMMAMIPLALVLSMGCSRQGEAESKAPAPEMHKEPARISAQSDSILVTFIELGSVKCVPCKMMQPVMEAIEKEYEGQVSVIFHDVWTDAGKPHAEKWGIRAIPTQIFLDKDGKEYFRHTGFFPKEELVDVLKQQGVQ